MTAGLVVEDWHDLGPHRLPLLMTRMIAAVSSVAPSPLDVSASVLIALEISDTDLWPQRPSPYGILGRQNPCGRLPPLGA